MLNERFSPELEDVFLLLVVRRHLADGVLQADGNLAVVGNPLTGALLVLIETHLLLIDHTVHVVPRPAETQIIYQYLQKCKYLLILVKYFYSTEAVETFVATR